MKINRLFSMAAAALVMAACSSEDLARQTKADQMQFSATIAAPNTGVGTRTVFSESGKDIKVAWMVGDEIALGHNSIKDVVTVKTVNADGSAIINGTITKPTDGEYVEMIYPAAALVAKSDLDYDFTKLGTQDGKLKYIQDNLDIRMDVGRLSVNRTGVTLKESVNMDAIFAIWKLALLDEESMPLMATQVKIKKGDEVLASTTELTTAISEVYLAVREVDDQELTIEATVSEDTYSYTQGGVILAPGKYYHSVMEMKKPTLPVATISTAPAATPGDIIAGSTKALVTTGTASGGTMMYAVTSANTKPTFTEGFSDKVPTAATLAAGTYYVWYYAKADADHIDSAISSSGIAVTVTKPTAEVTTAPTATTGDIITGSTTALVTAGTASGGTMMYAVTTANTKPASTEGFSATVPTAESFAAGTYYVWFYAKADDSHTDSEISASGIAVTVIVNGGSLTPMTNPSDLITNP